MAHFCKKPKDTDVSATNDVQLYQTSSVKELPEYTEKIEQTHAAGSEENGELAGVAKVEAAQKVWGKRGYIYLLLGLVLASYIYSLDGTTTWQYLAYASSSVLEHSLSGTVQTAGSIIIAVGKPFMAKLADYIGRGETYIVVLLFYVIGYVLYASAQNIGQIAGAQILYSFGYTGLQMLTQVVLADVTTLRYRAFAGGVMTMPFVINGFISAEVVTGVMNGGGWRWGYGMFAILVPACLAPVIFSLLYGQYKAKKLNLLQVESDPNKNILKHPAKALTICAKEMDIPGLILVAAALALILLPLGLASGASRGWQTPSMIAMIVIGCLLVPVFITWEIVFAAKYGFRPIAPLRFFKNYNIAAACFIGFFDFVSFYLQYTYQYSFVSVVKTEWNYRALTYFSMTQTISLCVFGLTAGVILIYYRRPKWLLLAGLLIRLLGVGLMIHSRGALGSDAELVWCQLLQGIGGGFASVITQLIAQALVSHNDVAVVTALVLLITEIGNSVGSAIATAVWTNQMPTQLAAHVPTTNATLLAELYGSITNIAAYPAGDPVREGVIQAYSVVMRNLCIGATVVAIFPPIVTFFFVSDIRLDNKQNQLENKTLTGDKVVDT
ncbi:major facilitator superfamily domain-containing protein [Dichotomocladium elegans]|nr:major facilitator superfamily domain-containing protein [Dichotomocladium elegans]